MNMEEYIQSGKLEEYILGLLDEEEAAELLSLCKDHPKLNQEINEIDKSMFRYLSELAVPVSEGEKSKLFNALDLIEKDIFLPDSYPKIHKYSDYTSWTIALKDELESLPDDKFVMKTIWQNADGELSLIKSRRDIMPETHHDLHESFLLLQGTCTCIIGEKTYYLQTGDFLEIPLDVDHNVIITSEVPVIAILQRLAA